MPAKRYPVLLDSEQRESLIRLISIGKDSARKLTQIREARARILLKADESEGAAAYADKQIREALEVSLSTIERTRKTQRREQSVYDLRTPFKFPSPLKVSLPH